MSRAALAQINIARARFSLDAPEMASFFSRVSAVQALAARSPGFVWRLAEEAPGDTTLEVFDDPRIISNLTVWESFEALDDFVHRTAHARVMGRRAEWFDELEVPHLAMWWCDHEDRPTLACGRDKLSMLAEHGPTPNAFTPRARFDKDGAPVSVPGAAA